MDFAGLKKKRQKRIRRTNTEAAKWISPIKYISGEMDFAGPTQKRRKGFRRSNTEAAKWILPDQNQNGETRFSDDCDRLRVTVNLPYSEKNNSEAP